MKSSRFTRLNLIAVLMIFIMAPAAHAVTKIKYTRHNLSSTGKYSIKSSSETQICIFCHAPHNTESIDTPLWSHAKQDVSVGFQMASTANVSPNRGTWADPTPTGISKKCLSCHDGTVAIGALANGNTIAVTGASGGSGDTLAGARTSGGGLISGDYGFIGTDLRGGHVISFNYEQTQGSLPVVDYRRWADIKSNYPDWQLMFDRTGKMQCHTCHDPHNDWCNDSADTVGKDPLWRKPCDGGLKNDEVCKVCHLTAKPGPFQKYSF